MGDHSAPDQNTVTDLISWLTPDRRKKLYVILTAVASVLAVYGAVDQEQIAAWLSLAATILIGGTAALHTPKPTPPSPLAGLTYNISAASPDAITDRIAQQQAQRDRIYGDRE